MKITHLITFSLYILCLSNVFGQKELKDYYLKRNLKQGGEQFQFDVLDEDKHGVWFHRKNKDYYWYKAQRVLTTQGGSSGSLLNGDFESFYSNKQLSKKGHFKKGLKVGEWLYWREDGSLRESEKWALGILKMKSIYNEGGRLISKTKFSGDNYHEETKDTIVNSRRGGIKKTIYIKNDNGKIVRSEEYKNGRLNGKVNSYLNGKLIISEKYKDGKLVSTKKMEKQKKEKPSWFGIFKKKKEDKGKTREHKK